jgi:hypothetical protein
MAKSSLIAITLAIIILICVLSSCSQHTVLPESESVTGTNEETLTVIEEKSSNEVIVSGETTEVATTELGQTEKSTEVQTTKKAESTTVASRSNPTTTQTSKEPATTKAPSTTKAPPSTTKAPETTTQKPTTTQPTTVAAIDIDYYINYAINYGKSIGLVYAADARDCWDTPIGVRATNHDAVIRDIKDRLDGYRYHDGDEYFCVWAEKRSDDRYELFIGYA